MTPKRPTWPESRRVKTVQVSGFTLTEGFHPKGTMLPWHDHAGPTICFVLDGGFTEFWHGGAVACRRSTLKLTPAGERHWDRFDQSEVRGIMIEADLARAEAIRPYADVLDERVSFQGGPLAGIAQRVHDEFRRMDDAAPLAIEGLLLELVATASRSRIREAQFETSRWLANARDILHADVAARPTLTSLAMAVGVHPVTLARAFRRTYGCTVGEYLRRLRIERATQQLGETELSLVEIAVTAGFSDQSHFSNIFRRYTGMSPSQFRRALRVPQRTNPLPRSGPVQPELS